MGIKRRIQLSLAALSGLLLIVSYQNFGSVDLKSQVNGKFEKDYAAADAQLTIYQFSCSTVERVKFINLLSPLYQKVSANKSLALKVKDLNSLRGYLILTDKRCFHWGNYTLDAIREAKLNMNLISNPKNVKVGKCAPIVGTYLDSIVQKLQYMTRGGGGIPSAYEKIYNDLVLFNSALKSRCEGKKVAVPKYIAPNGVPNTVPAPAQAASEIFEADPEGEVIQFQCETDGDYEECRSQVRCPSDKRIVAISATCDFSWKKGNDRQPLLKRLAMVPANQMIVTRVAADESGRQLCQVNTDYISEKYTSISASVGSSYANFGCRKGFDPTDKGCRIVGKVICY